MDSFLSKPIIIPFITSINLNGLPSTETFHFNGLSFNLHKAFHENHEHPDCVLTIQVIDGSVVDVTAKGNVSRHSKNYFVVEDYHQYIHAPFPITFEFEFKSKKINFCLASQTVDIPYNVLKYLKFGEYYQRNISLTPKQLQGKISKDITFNGYWTRKIDALKGPIFEYNVVNKKGVKIEASEKDCIYHVPDLHQYPKNGFEPQNLSQPNSWPTYPGQNSVQQLLRNGNIPTQQQNVYTPMPYGPNNIQPPMAPQQQPPLQMYDPQPSHLGPSHPQQQHNGPGPQPGYGIIGPRASYPSFRMQNIEPAPSLINGNVNQVIPQIKQQQLLKQEIEILEMQKQELQHHQQQKKVQLQQLQQQAELQQKRDFQKLLEECGATLPPHLAPQPQMYGPHNPGYRQMPLPHQPNSFEINFFIDLDVFENSTEIEKTCSETISDEIENGYGDILFLHPEISDILFDKNTRSKNTIDESQKSNIGLNNEKHPKEYQTATAAPKPSNDEAAAIISEKNPPKMSDNDEEKIINDEIEKLQERLQNILKSDQIVDKPVSRVTSHESSKYNEMNEANNGWSDLRPEDIETSKVQEKFQKIGVAPKRFDYSEISTVSFPPNLKFIKSPQKISSNQNSSEVKNIDTIASQNLKNPNVLPKNDGLFQTIQKLQIKPKGMSEAWKESHPGWEKGIWDFHCENKEKIEKNAVHYNPHISEIPNNNLSKSKSHFDKDKRDVFVHVQAGETLNIKIGSEIREIRGPATIRLISPPNPSNSPINVLPLRVPPGHIVQQIVDEEGRLNHVILSPCASTKTLHSNVEELAKNVDKYFQLTQKLQQAKSPKGMSEAWKERHPGWENGAWDFQSNESKENEEKVSPTAENLFHSEKALIFQKQNIFVNLPQKNSSNKDSADGTANSSRPNLNIFSNKFALNPSQLFNTLNKNCLEDQRVFDLADKYTVLTRGDDFEVMEKSTWLHFQVIKLDEIKLKHIMEVKTRIEAASKFFKPEDFLLLKSRIIPTKTRFVCGSEDNSYILMPKHYASLNTKTIDPQKPFKRLCLPENEVQSLVNQMAEMMEICHKVGLFFGDFKFDKFVFIDYKMTRLRIRNPLIFHLSENINSTTLCGTKVGWAFMAPEMLTRSKTNYCGIAADMWALGVFAFTLLTGNYPFVANEPQILFEKIRNLEFSCKLEDFASSDACNLVYGLLVKDPMLRPPMSWLKKCLWLRKETFSTQSFNFVKENCLEFGIKNIKNSGITSKEENSHALAESEKSSPSKPDTLEDDDYITISDDDDETIQEDYQEEEEKITCFCGEKNYGDMICCENEDCHYKWFHYECVGISTSPNGKWWCFDCSLEKGLNFRPTKAWLKKYHSQGKEKVVSQKQMVDYFAKEIPSQNGNLPLKNIETIIADEHHSTDSSISRPSSSDTSHVSKKWGAFFICRDGTKIYGRKEKLSKISPILKAIIDSSKTNICEIETDFDFQIIYDFVKYSNGDENGIIGNEIELYKAAKLYSVDNLKDKCVTSFINRMEAENSAVNIYESPSLIPNIDPRMHEDIKKHQKKKNYTEYVKQRIRDYEIFLKD